MGIRYGRISMETGEVQWFHVSHCECDGIGGFARLLRDRGAKNLTLPESKHPCRDIFLPLWRLLLHRGNDGPCAVRSDWLPAMSSEKTASEDVAWHLFTQDETQEILRKCREQQVTVNSTLLQLLDQTIRPEIRRPQHKITWIVPVNLRGDIHHADDTQNHVSCVEVRIAAGDTAASIQHQILQRLQRGEHRANHLLLTIGGVLSHKGKVRFLIKDRAKTAGNIGSFSNLGVWNLDERTSNEDAWVFCPPVVTGQLLGAGCVTFQGRLGLALQGNSAISSASATQRIARWVSLIREL